MQVSLSDILTILSIVAVSMFIVLAYHLIFVSVSLRRITDRIDDVSKEVEGLILKPIGAIEYLLEWFSVVVENMMSGKQEEQKKVHHPKK